MTKITDEQRAAVLAELAAADDQLVEDAMTRLQALIAFVDEAEPTTAKAAAKLQAIRQGHAVAMHKLSLV